MRSIASQRSIVVMLEFSLFSSLKIIFQAHDDDVTEEAAEVGLDAAVTVAEVRELVEKEGRKEGRAEVLLHLLSRTVLSKVKLLEWLWPPPLPLLLLWPLLPGEKPCINQAKCEDFSRFIVLRGKERKMRKTCHSTRHWWKKFYTAANTRFYLVFAVFSSPISLCN